MSFFSFVTKAMALLLKWLSQGTLVESPSKVPVWLTWVRITPQHKVVGKNPRSAICWAEIRALFWKRWKKLICYFMENKMITNEKVPYRCCVDTVTLLVTASDWESKRDLDSSEGDISLLETPISIGVETTSTFKRLRSLQTFKFWNSSFQTLTRRSQNLLIDLQDDVDVINAARLRINCSTQILKWRSPSFWKLN